ncbi:Glycosyltransferase [Caballeronia glathei]|uniref:glycosyltransferase family 4 protein n=1 Tax=Caballeronia glathei TaxID=60547 RepID=UPI0005033F31|nr:glycosyltransferase family 4 protein [Caballeronia glathei]CDY75308.1 Glycosyltransferase [Caballeronia glathei]
MNSHGLKRRLLPGRYVSSATRPRSGDGQHAHTPTVLFVDQSGELGGAEFALLPLAAACAARSEVVLLADGPFRGRLEASGVRVQVLNDARVSNIDREALRLNWLYAAPAIIRQVCAIAQQARRFDVLFLNTQKALVLGALGKPLHRRQVVWYLHDIMSRDHFGRVQLMIVRLLARHVADRIIVNSSASAQALIELTGLPASAMPVVHNGIDASVFTQLDAGDLPALRRRLGLPETAWLAGLFGRLAPWKGQHIAIDALPELPHVHLVLVGGALFGEDAYEAQLREQAQRLGVADRVHFAGFRDDMAAWMKAMDVILHTSTESEPFGRVVIEGMAAARPVIATGAGGVMEIVRHLENGWLVRPRDVAGLVEAIETLRTTPELGQRLAAQACADVQRHFTLDRYLQQMTDVIDHARR